MMNKIFHILLIGSIILSLCTPGIAGGNKKYQSFNKAKKVLLEKVYHDHMQTFYCGCDFSSNKQIIDYNGYKPKKEGNRARRIEIEHIVPAHDLGRKFEEYRDGHDKCVDNKGNRFRGRNCARKMVPEFRYMESDLYNLVPAVGEINALRNNYGFEKIEEKEKQFGKCKIKIINGKIEPPKNVRGDIARIYMYMHYAYPRHKIISSKNRRLFKVWAKQDPVDKWECARGKRINEIQGNYNPYIADECRENKMWK